VEVGCEVVTSDDEASDFVASGLNSEDLVPLRVVEETGVDVFVCEPEV
jgi:hypothetical protein